MITIILFIVLLVLIAIFSVQNAIPVTVTFFLWRFEASLAIIIFITFLIGLLAGTIFHLFVKHKKKRHKINNLKL